MNKEISKLTYIMENTDNKPIKTKRELMLARMREKYPEQDFENEDNLFGQIHDDYDAYDKQIADYKERESSFANMFTSDPRSAAFLMSWKNGEDPTVNLVRQFGTDIKEAIDDPEKQEEMAAAQKEFVERVAKEKEYEEMYQKNLSESLAMLDAVQQEKGLSDDDIDKIMEFVVTIVKDGVLGKFTKETIDMAHKALYHDADVAQASHEGEVKGRNEKIDEKLRKKKANDGTAMLDSKSGKASRQVAPSLGALDSFGDESKNIWERGDEKRRKANY